MGHGGARVGAGRKPKKATVVSMSGRPFVATLGPAPADAASSPLATPPEGMREAEAAVWRELAPHAIAQMTLVPGTLRGFRELCEHVVMKQSIADTIAAAGPATSGMDALLRHYAKLAQRVDASLARYRLTAQGKPEPTAVVKPKAASPWAMAAGAK